ncbi:hypothetical protein JMUB7488_28340 [Staphylococcus aureus]
MEFLGFLTYIVMKEGFVLNGISEIRNAINKHLEYTNITEVCI